MYISTCAVVRSRHCGFQRDPEVSGLPKWRLVALQYPTSGHWAAAGVASLSGASVFFF